MGKIATPPGGSEPPPNDPLAVCTLPGDQLADRLAWIRREILPHAVSSERRERGLAFELTEAPGLAEKLDLLIRLERDCCSGIAFERVASEAPGRLRFEIHGIDPDAPVVKSLGVLEERRR